MNLLSPRAKCHGGGKHVSHNVPQHDVTSDLDVETVGLIDAITAADRKIYAVAMQRFLTHLVRPARGPRHVLRLRLTRAGAARRRSLCARRRAST